MPYREKIKISAAEGPQKLLNIWREERAFRIGKALCYSGVILSAIATVADFFWSAPSVLWTDLVLLAGCALSLYWIRSPIRPTHYWVPVYLSLWISILPSLWTTGGISTPFLGVDLAAIYIIGAVMDTKNRSIGYLIFSLLHIPVLYLIEIFHPLSAVPQPPASLIAIISTVTMMAVFICIHAMLRTERELSLEFATHYRNLSKTEDELKRRERQLSEAQTIGRIGSWEWDLESDKIDWSAELFRIFEVDQENFNPSFKAYISRLRPDMRERIQKTIETSIETGDDFVFENVVTTSEGERFILSRGRVVKALDGKTTKMLGTSQDITDRKKIESELVKARDELEKRVEERTLQLAQSLDREKMAKMIAENANQAKMQFLANMSHEIRTPMNSILGFSELLSSRDHSPAESATYLERIRGNGKHLLHLIDDILDLSKFEAGQIPIHKGSFNLRELVDNAISSFLPSLKTKGLDLKLDYEVESSMNISTDSQRLSQVLTNLLSNAIKFSDHGQVRLRVRSESLNAIDQLRLKFDIEDTGIGISEESQLNLFQPFSQADSSIARKFGGSGLGLVLSRRICEALGGELELKKSVPQHGSHFSFQIPVEETKTDQEDKGKSAGNSRLSELGQFSNRRILLAEDSPDNAYLICHCIKTLGAQIDVVGDGLQAVEMVAKNEYDCVLMDIQMPGMDGLDATRRLRAMGFRKPIIALTAHALPAETAKSLEAGCDLHFIGTLLERR